MAAFPLRSSEKEEELYRQLQARERELEVARALDLGKSRPQIAREFGLSQHTVGTLSKRIYRKLGVHSRAELSTRLKAA
jgi:DNA-binding NarL/FixJ family response regulator